MRSIEVRYIDEGESSLVDVLGIDISKADFHGHLIQGKKEANNSFPNGPAGFRRLRTWLRNRGCTRVHVCMESTGPYWLGLASALHAAGLEVSVVNPTRTVNFARSQLRRTKTDRVDAAIIADFCKTQKPGRWSPPPQQILELRGLLSYRAQLIDDKVRLVQVVSQIHVSKELSRLHTNQIKTLEAAIATVGKQLQSLVKADRAMHRQVQQLTAVKGFGALTAFQILADLPVERLRNGKAAAAYAGLTPRERQSGTSIHGQPRICKTGSASLRRALFMPATVAMRHNPILKTFAERLKAKGKPAKVVTVAVMRKLIVLAFTVLKRDLEEAVRT